MNVPQPEKKKQFLLHAIGVCFGLTGLAWHRGRVFHATELAGRERQA